MTGQEQSFASVDAVQEAVASANTEIKARNLVPLTWGTASARFGDRLYIKPSGVPYSDLEASSIVTVEIDTGRIIEDNARPSVDTWIHRELYMAFKEVVSVIHTHSIRAMAFAQARRSLLCMGTTQADYNVLAIPVTGRIDKEEDTATAIIATVNYWANAIKRRLRRDYPEILDIANTRIIPGVLVAGHGPFVWGVSTTEAVENAELVEIFAQLNKDTWQLMPLRNAFFSIVNRVLPPRLTPLMMPTELMVAHFVRKHGDGSRWGIYGQ